MSDYRIIRSAELIENDHGATKTTDVLDTVSFNIAMIRKVSDDVKSGYDSESDVAYFVLDGEGDCVINGEKHHLTKGDCVFYPKGTVYKHLNGLTLLAISSPPFDYKKRVYTE